MVFHYTREVLEGLETYAHEDGSIWRFHADVNAARFRHSTRRLALPKPSVDDLLIGINRPMEMDRD